MAYANGRIPESALARIPGSGPYGGPKLRADAARAYNALHEESLRRYGISMALDEGSVGRAYRSYPRQVLAKRIYGADAAEPGTSNHGWGLAVDLMNARQRWVIDQIGHLYGFSKRWSDAAWEWWHIKYRPGTYPAVERARRFRPLRKGSRGPRVRWVQRRLRAKGYLSVKVTGYYGEATHNAVRRFQKKKGLSPVSGTVGPKTWKALSR